MSSSPDRPSGYYPQRAYYAPGWPAPVEQPPPPPDRRRLRVVLAVVGAVVALVLAAGVVLGVLWFRDTRLLGEVDAARSATPRQLDVGHCVGELPGDGAVDRVRVVPCSEPHEAEVVAVHTLRGETWPGHEDVDAEVAAACEMDTAQRDAGFSPVVWAPSQTGWGQGDRRGLCLAWSGGDLVTGSFVAGDEVARTP